MKENRKHKRNKITQKETTLKEKKENEKEKKLPIADQKQESEAAGPPPSSVYLIAGAAALPQLAVHGSTVARFPSPSTPLVVELEPRKRIDCLRGGGGGNRREREERKLIFFFGFCCYRGFVGLN
ncbi:hypothetical protein M9H77_23095 [Catharanthus roseus]|uniref:Uncharacterized protein n=1 Tax=Catharanthus roseus TaxID=4058 RepID=A0ACC0ATJ5_CATRO|nr:hypothetical protein M9H77_23095 [Catharanthus roseus]